jgi:hypothetical protein
MSKRKQAKQLKQALDIIDQLAFPNGESDIQRDMQIVSSVVGNKIADKDLRGFTVKCKSLVYVAENKFDSQRFVESNTHYSDNKLSNDEAYNIYAIFMRERLGKEM